MLTTLKQFIKSLPILLHCIGACCSTSACSCSGGISLLHACMHQSEPSASNDKCTMNTRFCAQCSPQPEKARREVRYELAFWWFPVGAGRPSYCTICCLNNTITARKNKGIMQPNNNLSYFAVHFLFTQFKTS